MEFNFFKYQGTGNDFVMIDGKAYPQFYTLPSEAIALICDRRFGIGADGLIIIAPHPTSDFEMLYFNADGKLGSFCGNGARCAVAFAKKLGYFELETSFQAADGLHKAQLNAYQFVNDDSSSSLTDSNVSLLMQAVSKYYHTEAGFFVNTGSPHLIIPVDDVQEMDVFAEGKALRNHPLFQERGGTNVNFVELIDEHTIAIRTYERGVEDETFSCGTGAVASALYHSVKLGLISGSIEVLVKGGNLQVSFMQNASLFDKIYLRGPAKEVFQGIFKLSI